MENYKIILENIDKFYINKQAQKVSVLNSFGKIFDQTISYALVGHSGCGKTTLLNILAGFDKEWRGKISYSPNLKAPKFGFIFQNNYLIQQLSSLQNVAISAIIQGVPRKEALERSESLLEQLGMSEKQNAYPGELSGGQQARVCIARGLVTNPDFLLADEPTANLDFQTAQTVIEALLKLKKNCGVGLIISTHDMDLAQRLDQSIKMG